MDIPVRKTPVSLLTTAVNVAHVARANAGNRYVTNAFACNQNQQDATMYLTTVLYEFAALPRIIRPNLKHKINQYQDRKEQSR